MRHYGMAVILSVINGPTRQSVTVLNVVMLSVVSPFMYSVKNLFNNKCKVIYKNLKNKFNLI